MSFIGKLIFDMEGQQHTTGDADRQTKNIDQREDLVLNEVSDGDFNVILEHLFELDKIDQSKLVPTK
jgi:hypothetical protein